ncbi:MAG: FAD:protein FMN transferase [Bacteroidales bacterium]
MTRLQIVLLFFLLVFTSCRNKRPEYSTITGFAQGSTYNMIFENSKHLDPSAVNNRVGQILHAFDLSLSLYVDSSIVSRINRNDTVTCDSFFIENFEKSRKIWQLTGGAFDVTVAPLVKAWGFGPDAHKNISDAKRDSILKLVGMEKVELRDRKIIKSDPRITLDFNAIAQGYSVDVMCMFFDGLGIKNYLVEIGGEVRVKGEKAGKLWRIGIDKPVDDNMIPGSDLEAVISLKDKAISTSGNYRKFYVENGIKYSHEIDPKTGNPARNTLLSASILADECATADGIATACMVIGKDNAIEFLNLHHEYEGYLIYSDESGNFRTWTSEKLKSSISESGNK